MEAWYVKPLRMLGDLGHFVLDVKLGLDLGRGWRKSLQVAMLVYGVR